MWTFHLVQWLNTLFGSSRPYLRHLHHLISFARSNSPFFSHFSALCSQEFCWLTLFQRNFELISQKFRWSVYRRTRLVRRNHDDEQPNPPNWRRCNFFYILLQRLCWLLRVGAIPYIFGLRISPLFPLGSRSEDFTSLSYLCAVSVDLQGTFDAWSFQALFLWRRGNCFSLSSLHA